ncbi:Hypothetical_protein [Hexamita inflata]|uniref:Hypothetical_protein n=1 Tax=Hexamita inflata TaxID=28002 RepID=A0AA86QX40_9EUKA|nr:Hypothetical protein HINF_LOCUS55326 [Hexamita inflata]
MFFKIQFDQIDSRLNIIDHNWLVVQLQIIIQQIIVTSDNTHTIIQCNVNYFKIKLCYRSITNQSNLNSIKRTKQALTIQKHNYLIFKKDQLALKLHSGSFSSNKLSTGSMSTNVFWDQSEVKDVKMLYVSGSNGKRSVQEVTISTGITAVERSQDDLDIYDLLF